MTFVFDARAFEPALPANDTDDGPVAVPVLRLVETPETPRRRRFRPRLPRTPR